MSRLRTVGYAVLGVVLVVALFRVLAGPERDDRPLDPRNVGPEGLAAVVALLDDLDVEVRIALEPPDEVTTRVFVPLDVLSTARQDELLRWVEEGGTLVVADPRSELVDTEVVANRPSDLLGASAHPPDCDLAAVAEVRSISHRGWSGLAPRDEAATAAARCFPVGEGGDWLVVTDRGAGRVVALGSADPFVNGRLGDADNAVLATALLGAAPGDRVVVVPRPPVGDGDATLADLVPRRVVDALWLAAVAVVVAVVWRGRRLGEPVPERLPPVVPSAELARAVGDLLQRAGSRDGAAARLRADARRVVGHRLGASTDLTPTALADLVVDRLEVDAERAHRALVDTSVTTDHELAAVAAATAELRRALASPDRTAPSPTTRSSP